jgi:hypothetical protein
LRKRHSEITTTGYQVIAITPSNKSLLEQFVEAFGPFPFPIYGDPERALYRSMGHVSMPKWKLMQKAAVAYLKGGSKVFMPKDESQQRVVKKSMKTQDLYIQGGTWLFNEKGEVLWSHIDQSPEDHARIDEILAVMKKL